jgi:hypothetical protein
LAVAKPMPLFAPVITTVLIAHSCLLWTDSNCLGRFVLDHTPKTGEGTRL